MPVKTDVGKMLIEAAEEVEDEGAIGDDLTEVAKIICHMLHTPIVIHDGKITLNEATELGVEIQGMGHMITEELRFHGNPRGACSVAAP